MDLALVVTRPDVQGPTERVILLDTNALIWLHHDHVRAAPLRRANLRLYSSPANLLELQFLVEAGRLRPRGSASLQDLARDPRWIQDDPPSIDWFNAALETGWTHDPFDRLLVAHARLRRWRLATSDLSIIEHLRTHEYLSCKREPPP